LKRTNNEARNGLQAVVSREILLLAIHLFQLKKLGLCGEVEPMLCLD
jgi:hypothetical protein